MFEEDPRVLYISLHRFDIFPFKPEESDCNVVGSGSGAGYTVNIAWPKVFIIQTELLSSVFLTCTNLFHSYREGWATRNTLLRSSRLLCLSLINTTRS